MARPISQGNLDTASHDSDVDAFRHAFESGGRVHVDRPMPFIALNRYPKGHFSLAQRIAAISPSSMIWPARADADFEARASLADILARRPEGQPHFLQLVLHDLAMDETLENESPRLEQFRFVLNASADPCTQTAMRSLEVALGELCIEHREPRIEHAGTHPGIEWFDSWTSDARHVSWISLGIPQIHRVPGEERIYPEIFHALETGVLDALLKAFAAFTGAATSSEPVHHRGLGRRRFIDAALHVDQELARISRSFDFLLSISPINTAQAFEHFSAGKCESDPVFRYRPLTISPDLIKRDLYALDIRSVEDPVLETLFREKQQEIDQQLIMIHTRNTPAFRHASLLQYGSVEPDLLDEALDLLAGSRAEESRSGGGTIDCHAIKAAAEKMLARYRISMPAFKARVVLRDDIAAGLMVSGHTLMISTTTCIPGYRLDALLQHEISVHLLTCVNGSAQGLQIFETGLAGYEGIQEGLGVFAEFLVDGLTRARLRLLAARVVAVDAMLDGAGFVDCHRLLSADHGFSSQGAFNIVARVFRSGGLSKDAIYLRGIKRVVEYVAEGEDLEPFWFGKIAEHHVPVVAELRTRGMLRPPPARPEFLDRPSTQAHLRRIRDGGSFADLFRSSAPC